MQTPMLKSMTIFLQVPGPFAISGSIHMIFPTAADSHSAKEGAFVEVESFLFQPTIDRYFRITRLSRHCGIYSSQNILDKGFLDVLVTVTEVSY